MPRGYDKSDLNKGLLLSLPFDEGTGTVSVQDVAKPHHPVLMTHAPVWTQLSSGLWVLAFDGTNDYMSIAAASAPSLDWTTGSFSFAFWISPTRFGSFSTLYDRQTLTKGFRIRQDLGMWFEAEGGYFPPNNDVVGSTWQLYSFTRQGVKLAYYRNGGMCSTNDNCTLTMTSKAALDVYIGQSQAGTERYQGSMWGFRIWSRALSPAEHMEIFNRERDLFGV